MCPSTLVSWPLRACARWDNGELIHPKPWDIIDKLHLINVPTLITNGGDEQAQDHVVAPFFWKIPKTKWVMFKNSTHTAFWEERERYIRVVEEFLRP
jgi:pimeloyl-ACP methyl ester carboxylesterase